MSNAAPVIEVRGLGVSLGGRTVMKDIHFDVRAGEFVGLIGPNGAGKTTMMRALLGLIPTDSGHVTISGAQGRGVRHHAGYVPQRHEFAWDYPIDVHGLVMNGRTGLIGWFKRAGQKDFDAVHRALDMVGMTHLADRPIGELSGGQKQRVLIARALSIAPKVLFLDEPFTGLDMPSAESLLELFHRLAEEGTAIVMSTHNLVEAVSSCDRILLFNGQIVADAAPEELERPEPWIETFRVSEHSPLLVSVGALRREDARSAQKGVPAS
ncbi:hypothetical protein CULC809_00362 [Corynebacterium ulcerans 809]|uniref:anchored repeat-type ABC transporter ATP-binding subunit n=1 Tax=Corynebacterium ulcerans TaxID=65058 RepID=UPI00021851A2|nr:anchored repeat-type ABC transporter ATP-binding subunit [Corynebacterium ulcerans]AEG80902.1 hypothetical protein CULC809_00362 [Corynebacterium ulcerans 809]